MSSDDRFEDRLRALADQIARSLAETDFNDVAGRLGVDPDRARNLGDAVGTWLSDRASGTEPLFGGGRAAGRPEDPRGDTSPPADAGAPGVASAVGGPHPLDLPTDAQGRALSALDAGRWTVEPGTSRLLPATATGVGTAPPAAGASVDLANELHARDWITTDGGVTLVGRQALLRWCATAPGQGEPAGRDD